MSSFPGTQPVPSMNGVSTELSRHTAEVTIENGSGSGVTTELSGHTTGVTIVNGPGSGAAMNGTSMSHFSRHTSGLSEVLMPRQSITATVAVASGGVSVLLDGCESGN